MGRFYTREPQTQDPDESSLTFELQSKFNFELLQMVKYYFIILFKIAHEKIN